MFASDDNLVLIDMSFLPGALGRWGAGASEEAKATAWKAQRRLIRELDERFGAICGLAREPVRGCQGFAIYSVKLSDITREYPLKLLLAKPHGLLSQYIL